MSKIRIPTNRELAWATLEALKNHGRPLATSEIAFPVVKLLQLNPKVLNIPRKNGRGFEVPYRIGWTLTNLKEIGAVQNVERGYWSLTKSGMRFRDYGDVRDRLLSQYGPELLFGNKEDDIDPKCHENSETRKSTLLDRLETIDSGLFVSICCKFLRKAGIRRVRVIDRTSNGSFEGTGMIQISTTSFRVFFRCRRCAPTINKIEVENFRGTVVGRAENGLYITTGKFSDSAREEATRDGAPPIGLIEGADLCDQIRRLLLDKQI